MRCCAATRQLLACACIVDMLHAIQQQAGIEVKDVRKCGNAGVDGTSFLRLGPCGGRWGWGRLTHGQRIQVRPQIPPRGPRQIGLPGARPPGNRHRESGQARAVALRRSALERAQIRRAGARDRSYRPAVQTRTSPDRSMRVSRRIEPLPRPIVRFTGKDVALNVLSMMSTPSISARSPFAPS